MITLQTSVSELPKIGKSLAKSFKKLEIETVQDLLFYFPYKYLDFTKFTEIKNIKPNETITVRGHIKTIQNRFSFKTRKSLCEAIVSDATGSIKVVWFNQGYIATYLKTGDEVLLSGKATIYKQLQLANPVYEKISEEQIHTGRLVPVYHVTDQMYNKTLRTIIKTYLPLAKELPDSIPTAILEKYNLLNMETAVTTLHFPTTDADLAKAKQRIVFDEIFIQQLAVRQHKSQLAKAPAPKIPAEINFVKKFLTTLPFTLTRGQKQALWEIMQDMEQTHPMNRLLEGDVGSGKTLVAVLAAFEAARAGFQVAVLAPTEILAQQHYASFSTYAKPYSKQVHIGLLTNHFSNEASGPIKKQELLTKVKNAKITVLIGTHAIVQKKLEFSNLGLVIIDEQHRFGVAQRAFLHNQQSKLGQVTPHLLSMSATPIPRTLALALYGDLAISTLTELPQGRERVASSLVPETKRAAAYEFIKKEVANGRQVFIVTPRVEESDKSELRAAKAEFVRLSTQVFPELKLGLIYGKMKGTEKETAMQSFYKGELDILVATSVIEIGIDVPNATIMLIEGAERFGLAQLHQLRGRVGRGRHKSYCLLFTDSADEASIARLKTFATTGDGFKLAELDLAERGFGSLFGTEQTGFDFRFSRYLTETVLKLAQSAANDILKDNPSLHNYPELRNKVTPLLETLHLE